MIQNLSELIPALQAAKKWHLQPEPPGRAQRLAWLQKLENAWGRVDTTDLELLSTEMGLSPFLIQAWDLEGGKSWLSSFVKGQASRPQSLESVPRGVLSLLQPRVHGLRLLIERLAPALLAGNSVFIKMSGRSPRASQVIDTWLREAGVPTDVAQVVLGQSSEYSSFLISHPAIQGVSFVGRPETAEDIQKESSSLKRVFQGWTGGRSNLLELGSRSAMEWKGLLQSSLIESRGQRPYDLLRVFVLEKEEASQLTVLEEVFKNWPWLKTSVSEAEAYRECLDRMQAEEGRLVIGGDIEITDNQGRIRPALVAHLAQCSEEQQVQRPFPILLFSGVKYAFDAAKWVNNAAQGFALRINGESERVQKLVPKFEVGAILENGDFRPAQSLLFGVKESAVGNADLDPEGSFFSQKRRVFH